MDRRGPGERAGLSRESILDAALDLVERDGLRGLSMRRLARDLGVEAMTLYHYLPSKDALLDGLVERVIARTPLVTGDASDWRVLLRDYAASFREMLLRHPALLPLAQTRPAVTPATLAAVERALTSLVAAGFPLGRALDMVNALTLFVLGHTAAEAHMPQRDASEAGSAAWVGGLSEEDYPLLVRAARDGEGVDDARRFAFGVDALLAGYAAAVTSDALDA